MSDITKPLDEAINTISGLSPMHKINATLDNTNMAIGSYLLLEYNNIDPKYDLSSLNDDTIVYVDIQTIIEKSLIIAGGIEIAKKIGLSIKIDTCSELILKLYPMHKPMLYKDFKRIINVMASDIIGGSYGSTIDEYPKIIRNLRDIIINVWNLPFTELNRIIDYMQDDINKTEKEISNE